MLLKDLPKTAEKLIKNKLVKKGDCLIWTGALNKNGRPSLTLYDPKIKRGRTFSVQKMILDEKGEQWGGHKRYGISNTCGEKKCCNPEHLTYVPFTRKDFCLKVDKLRSEKMVSMTWLKDMFRDMTTMSYKQMDKKYNLSANQLHHYLLSNYVLYPYFVLLLKEFYGEELVQKIQNNELTATEIKQQFGLSRCVKTILTSDKAIPVKREKVYLSLMSKCVLHGRNVVWTGGDTVKIVRKLDDVVEVTPQQALAYAVYDIPLGTPIDNQGWYVKEMNPFKLGETDAPISN